MNVYCFEDHLGEPTPKFLKHLTTRISRDLPLLQNSGLRSREVVRSQPDRIRPQFDLFTGP
jgi:hypothetical protein